MGGFHDQYGNYRPDLVADTQKVEIARLRAKLANARLERDNTSSLNSSLIAELATEAIYMRQANMEIETLRAELGALLKAASPFADNGDILPGHWDAIRHAVRKARAISGRED